MYNSHNISKFAVKRSNFVLYLMRDKDYKSKMRNMQSVSMAIDENKIMNFECPIILLKDVTWLKLVFNHYFIQ